jgi:hypothetical protein
VRNHRLGTSLALVALGAVIAGTGTAAAATGGTFVLGRDNTASTQTILRNSSTAANLTLPAARAGQPPLAVSATSGKVNYLNTDKIDGLDSTAFSLAVGKVGTVEGFGEPLDLDDDGAADVYEAYAKCPAGSKVTGGGHEAWTLAGAAVSEPFENGWVVVSFPDDQGSVPDDVVALAQCYNPRGAVAGAVESFGSAGFSEQKRDQLLALAAKR